MSRPRRETHLMARWSKREKDLMHFYPGNASDGHLLHITFTRPLFDGIGKGFIQELEERGYDITTLRFSVERKARS